MLRMLRRLSRIGAALCVAIACQFCVLSVFVHLDRIEHALELDHHPQALAGTVECAVEMPDGCDSSDRAHPVAHTHQGDTPTTMLAAVAMAAMVNPSKGLAPAFSPARTGPGAGPSLPERPPKA